jgi:predicted lysophospholipase L1 biosynthesis ABC-type transport system permease subunit
VAVRTALGAGRGSLFRQFLTESLVLALAASAAAVFIVLGMMKVLVTLAAAQIPRAFEIGLDWTTFLFMLGVAVTTGLAFGIVPALYATKSDDAGTLNAASGRGSLGRGSVVINRALVVTGAEHSRMGTMFRQWHSRLQELRLTWLCVALPLLHPQSDSRVDARYPSRR